MIASLHKLYIRTVATALWQMEKMFFYKELRKAYRKEVVATPQLVVDVGANRGQSIRFFKRLYPSAKIMAFEPNADLAKHLRKKFGGKQVQVFQQGVAANSGTKEFFEHILDETSGFTRPKTESIYNQVKSRVLLSSPDKMVAKTYEVEVVALDDVLQDITGYINVLLKLDVEGYELQALTGAEQCLHKKMFSSIQLEQHDDDMHAVDHDAIHQLLTGYGYELRCKLKHPFGNFSELIYTPQ